MAEVILKSILTSKGIEYINVSSAGMAAWEGEPANQCAVEALKEIGIETGSHRAKKLIKQMLDSADIVLCMTRLQKKNISALFPESEGKVFSIYEYAFTEENNEESTARDVADPYGMPVEVYKKSAGEITDLLQRILKKILLKSGNN